MCDNPANNQRPIGNNVDPITGDTLDVWGCNHSSSRAIEITRVANNCILRSFESIKSAIICYINTVSETFRNLNAGVEYHERGKMNVIIETFISAVHQVCGTTHSTDKVPHFHLVVQEYDASDNALYSLGGLDANPGKGKGDRQFFAKGTANVPNLHPGKLSIIRNCEDYRNGDEILYYYILSFQLLYSNIESSLMVKVGSAAYGIPSKADKCLFPILVDRSACRYQLYNMVPETDDTDWEDAGAIYSIVHTLLIKNNDLMRFSAEIDRAISRCRITENCLATRARLLQYT